MCQEGPEPYEDDLLELSNKEAWEDEIADRLSDEAYGVNEEDKIVLDEDSNLGSEESD